MRIARLYAYLIIYLSLIGLTWMAYDFGTGLSCLIISSVGVLIILIYAAGLRGEKGGSSEIYPFNIYSTRNKLRASRRKVKIGLLGIEIGIKRLETNAAI
jgi:hypothetical protein